MADKKSSAEYTPGEFEAKWQKVWADQNLYKTSKSPKNKKYILDMFPYPSGATLHVGHVEGYVGTDIVSRYERMKGNDVLHPMGWDAFGLPAENYAIKTGVNPDESTHSNIQTFKRQLSATGMSYDWEHEIDTSDPDFYRWTQWIFLAMFKRGLAYKKKAAVNWCPSCETVLANEQVVDGECERCGTEVEPKELEQWFFKITEYADRLIDGLDEVDWLNEVKIQQRNWIGRSEGAEVKFKVVSSEATQQPAPNSLTCFTTRPDTLYGTTFMVIAPDSPLVEKLTTSEQKKAISKYIKEHKEQSYSAKSASKGPSFRNQNGKTGVFTGSSVINPANGKEIPVYISNYVVSGYGLQAVMGVPAHDMRDFEFAKKYGIDIIPVVQPEEKYESEDVKNGVLQRSDNHKEVVKQLAAGANKSNKRLMLMGGWAAAAQVGETYREHGDIDMIVLEEELDWWKDSLKASGFELSNMFPEGQNDKYYFQATKPGIHIDVLTFKVEDGKVVSLTGEKPNNLEASFDEMFSLTKIDGEPVYAVTPEFIHKWKKDHQEKTGDIRWKEQADFLMLGLEPHTGKGRIINSGDWDDLSWPQDREKILASIEASGWGKKMTTYHIRDWLISRQRYWGAPIPMTYCQECADSGKGEREDMPGWYPVSEAELPVLLPKDVDFKPTGESPITRSKSFQEGVVCPNCGGPAKREVDTMDTYVDSSWYFIRFPDPKNKKEFASKKAIKDWLPVDVYVGAGHVVQHLLFARFFWKVLFDAGLIDQSLGDEPFLKLRAPGWILGPDSRKMSKRWNNVVTPDDIIPKFGADTLRMYEMFMGPFEAMKPWSMTGVEGMSRFLKRVWRLFGEADLDEKETDKEIDVLMNKLVKKVGEDIESMSFNTAISSMMETYNALFEAKQKGKSINWKEVFEKFCMVMAPFAPHVAEELWERMGNSGSIHLQSWPTYDESLIQDKEVEIPVQINGKLRGTVRVGSDEVANQEVVEKQAREEASVAKYLTSEPKKVIFVPGRLLNFVVE